MARKRPIAEQKHTGLWWLLLAIPVLVFLGPLFVAYGEYKLVGTSYVEDFFRAIGIHSTMEKLYDPIVEFLQWKS